MEDRYSAAVDLHGEPKQVTYRIKFSAISSKILVLGFQQKQSFVLGLFGIDIRITSENQ